MMCVKRLLPLSVLLFAAFSCRKEETEQQYPDVFRLKVMPYNENVCLNDLSETTINIIPDNDTGGTYKFKYEILEDSEGFAQIKQDDSIRNPKTPYPIQGRTLTFSFIGTKMGNVSLLVTVINPKGLKLPTIFKYHVDYKSVPIGNQVWMVKNLDVAKFRNGDTILEVTSPSEWVAAGKVETPAWCYYSDDPENGEKYGKLYNWYAVHDPRELAPKGWHIPTNAEWTALAEYLGGYDKAGEKMKSTTWGGTDNVGFTALPGGGCTEYGVFRGICVLGSWWSTSEYKKQVLSFCRYLVANKESFPSDYYYYEQGGLSVRCLKDNDYK